MGAKIFGALIFELSFILF